MNQLTDREAQPRSVVVVGIDFSETSLTALQTARGLARTQPSSELHLVHVLGTSPAPDAASEVVTSDEVALFETPATADAKLEQLVRRVAPSARDVGRVTGHLRLGDPVMGIVQLASDLSADLIVVGTHGRTGVSRLVFGSVAEKVVRYAPCPVLTVRPKVVPVWEKIEPPCPNCLAVQRATNRAQLWCDVHSQRHIRPHTYYEYPPSFGLGAQTFR